MAPQIISCFPKQMKESIYFEGSEKGPVEFVTQDALSADTKS